jgi:hypothetical protein
VASATPYLDAIALDGWRLRSALAAGCDLADAIYPRPVVAITRRLDVTRLRLLVRFGRERGGGIYPKRETAPGRGPYSPAR